MRLLCPNCQRAITIPDSDAGKSIACPLCSHSFAAPQLYTAPSFDQPLPPPIPAPARPPQAESQAPVSSTALTPVVAPPAPEPEPTSSPQPAAGHSLPEGYVKLVSMPLSHSVCEWLVPACLSLIFILTFFRWVGFFPAGYPAYTQNPWQAMFGDMSVDPVAEEVFKVEKPLSDNLHAAWWLIPYFLLLLSGMFLAWVVPVITKTHIKPTATVADLLRFRPAALAACVGLSLFLLLIQTTVGFGLEHAVRGLVPEEVNIERKEARTPEQFQKVYMRIAAIEGKFAMTGTSTLRLAIVLHFIALAAVLCETLLIHRGPKPPPRVGVMW